MSSGYFFAGSKLFGFIIQPSSFTPSPMSTWKNSIGGDIIGETAVASAALDSSIRTLLWAGRVTRSMTGGRSAVEYVWIAKCVSGEIL